MARRLALARPRARVRQWAASPATVNDVAGVAGVSRQTVSNVLNALERVHPSARGRVADAISQLGFRPDHAARSLKARRTRLLGYGVPRVDLPAHNPVIDGFLHVPTDAARREGYQVLLFTPEIVRSSG
jgi:DNA-binding LacI/PurR family transcriptional regulator